MIFVLNLLMDIFLYKGRGVNIGPKQQKILNLFRNVIKLFLNEKKDFPLCTIKI